jgi:hypothetical protein
MDVEVLLGNGFLDVLLLLLLLLLLVAPAAGACSLLRGCEGFLLPAAANAAAGAGTAGRPVLDWPVGC